MGQVFSGFEVAQSPSLGDVPENCLALILSHFDPPEICKLGLVNQSFYRASSSDSVWEPKLPENYQILVKKLFDHYGTAVGSSDALTKKDIYARLSCNNRFDGGTKAVWMEKERGGICVSVSWKGMKITGIDDRRYWIHIPTHESRFQAIAYLQQVWWLEVEGDLEFEFPAGSYSLFFRLRLGRPSKKLGTTSPDRVHGWEIKPVRFEFSTSNGEQGTSLCHLNLKAQGKWWHYHAGDFHVYQDSCNVPTSLKFSMTQIDCTHTKSGLSLDSVLICPTYTALE